MLDTDEGGTLDSDEIKAGFVKIGVLAPHYNMNQKLIELEASKVISRSDELNIFDFVQFMHVFATLSEEMAPNSESTEEVYGKVDLDGI